MKKYAFLFLFFCTLYLVPCLPPQGGTLSFAEPMMPVELAVAKACHFYDLGNLKEAMMEFQIVLKQDPGNKAANDYINKIWARLNETGISSWELSEQETGYKNALNARKKILITDQEKPVLGPNDKPFQRFINQTSIGKSDRYLSGTTDTSFKPHGLFISEHIRMDEPINDWQNTFSLDGRYDKGGHEDIRLRRIMYSLSRQGGMRFIAGDTSTNLSRYTLRGMYYRGVNFSMNDERNEFKILWGAEPHFMARTEDNPGRKENYIYPRKVFGMRDAFKVMDGYKVGVSMMDLRDTARVRSIDANYDPKLNRVYSVDQSIEVVPEKWRIETESAYSTSDEDITGQDILATNGEKTLKGFSNYIRSAIQMPKFKLINSYERIGADFRSYSDLASTNITWLSGITSDREILDNYLEYRPFDFDPIYLDLHLSRVRNNLEKENNLQMNKLTDYGAGLRFSPDIDNWLPQAGIRLKVTDRLGVPGGLYQSNDASDRDIIFELAKRLYGVDLNTSYTRRKAIENTETFGTYSNIYNIRAAKELTDMVLLSTEYSHSDIYKNQDASESAVGKDNFINLSAALRLWAGANLSLDYSYQNRTDTTGMLGDAKGNIYSTTFSWPFSRYFLDTGGEFNIAPYLTYMLDESRKDSNHYIWSAAMDATYQIAKDYRLSANFLYRKDQGNSTDYGFAEDKRFLLTYQKIFQ